LGPVINIGTQLGAFRSHDFPNLAKDVSIAAALLLSSLRKRCA